MSNKGRALASRHPGIKTSSTEHRFLTLAVWHERCLRRDLLIESPDQRRFKITDPNTGKFYHFGPEELFLAQGLNDEQDLETLPQRFETRFQSRISEHQLTEFFQELDRLGLLCDCKDPTPATDLRLQPSPAKPGLRPAQPATTTPAAQHQTVPKDQDGHQDVDAGMEALDLDDEAEESSPGHLTLFDPDRAFAFLARALYPLRWLVWLLVPGVPLALLALLFNDPAYQAYLQLLFRGDKLTRFLVFFVFTLLFVNLLSKLVQGVVALHFGAAIGKFGIRLVFGVKPRFFIAKKTIWHLSRHGRLWVFGSNLLTKLALFVIGTLVWLSTYASSPSLALFALTAGHAGLATFLFTANPFWRADGYAWLVSFLETPKLRERAFLTLQGLLRGGRGYAATLGSQERYALSAYALATLTFFLYFIGLVLFAVALSLEERFQGTGVVLFLVLLSIFLRWLLLTISSKTQRVTKALRRQTGADFLPPFEGDDHLNAALPGDPRTVTRERTAMTSNKAVVERSPWLRRGRNLLLLAILVTVGFLPYHYQIGGAALVKSMQRGDARARVSAEVIEVLVREGDWVEKEQLLAHLDDWSQQIALRMTEAQLAGKRAELALLRRGAKPEEVEKAQAELQKAQVQAQHSQHILETLRPGVTSGAVTAMELASIEKAAAVDAAEAMVAQRSLDSVASPPLPEAIAVAEAEVAELEEQRRIQQEELDRTRILAPLSGRITTTSLPETLGRFLAVGELFATIQDYRLVEIEIEIPETMIDDARLGAAVALRVWTTPLRTFEGVVTAIAPMTRDSTLTPFAKVVPVKAVIDNTDRHLLPGMTGFAKVEAGTKPAALAFGDAFVRFVTIELWSWIP